MSVQIPSDATQVKRKQDLRAFVLGPTGKQIEAELVPDGKGGYKVNFTLIEPGTYRTTVYDEKGNVLSEVPTMGKSKQDLRAVVLDPNGNPIEA